jgi:hypothetical protein
MAPQQDGVPRHGAGAGSSPINQVMVTAWSPMEKPQQATQKGQSHTQEASEHQKGPAQPQANMDCLGCRMVGLAFGLGGGGYIMSQLITASPAPKGAHRAGILAAAGAMFCMGMYRALWP